MSITITDDEPRFTSPDNNRFYKCARLIIRHQGTLGVRELAQRARMSEESSYQSLLAFRGVTQALRDAHLLPYDAAPKGEPASVRKGEVLTLEQAQQILKGETVLT